MNMTFDELYVFSLLLVTTLGLVGVPAVCYWNKLRLLIPPAKNAGPQYWGSYAGEILQNSDPACMRVPLKQLTWNDIIKIFSE